MRYRVKDYAIRVTAGNSSVRVYFKSPLSTFSADAIKEAIRLVVDEEVKEIFCSSMWKDKIGNIAQDSSTVSGFDTYIAFGYPSGKTISNSDKFTIEMDWGDEPSGLSGGGEIEIMTDEEYEPALEDLDKMLDEVGTEDNENA